MPHRIRERRSATSERLPGRSTATTPAKTVDGATPARPTRSSTCVGNGDTGNFPDIREGCNLAHACTGIEDRVQRGGARGVDRDLPQLAKGQRAPASLYRKA